MDDEFKKVAEKFIIDNKRNLPMEIGKILIKRNVRTIKGGHPILLGDFELLSKKKRERIYQIAEKLYNFFQDKKNLFTMNDIIELERFDNLISQKQRKVK